jgi:hypothetical protein
VRPGRGLTVEYGSDRLACDVLIEPPRPLLRTDEHDLFMSSEAVTGVLDEVVPLSMREKNLRKFDSEIGCNKSEDTEYENVSITRSTNECMPLPCSATNETVSRKNWRGRVPSALIIIAAFSF